MLCLKRGGVLGSNMLMIHSGWRQINTIMAASATLPILRLFGVRYTWSGSGCGFIFMMTPWSVFRDN